MFCYVQVRWAVYLHAIHFTLGAKEYKHKLFKYMYIYCGT